MQDRIPVPLELDDFEVVSAEVNGGVLEIEVRSTFPRACHHCGSVDVLGHGVTLRRIRDCPVGHPTVLLWHQRRFKCRDCGKTSRERHPAIPRRRRLTGRFRRHLFDKGCQQPFAQVADDEAVSAYRVLEAFEALAPGELSAPQDPPRVVALDESSFRRRFRFHTVLCDPERFTVLDMVEGRDQTAVVNAIGKLDPQVRAGIETVVMDCHWNYRRAVEDLLPSARIVADKFHIIRSIDGAAQKVRRRFGRQPKNLRIGRDGGTARQSHPASDPKVFRSRWVFMKRSDQLTEDERSWLDSVFNTQPEVGVAWLMKEAFAAIYQSPTRDEAERRLDVWVGNLSACGLKEFSNTWRTLDWWREQILAYFEDPITNAFAEGITNKIKVMKRMSYGFANSRRYRQKALLNCRRRRSRAATHQNSR